ncbi:MAG: hypothetical protein GC146_03650 [Limimaricola sp.]|nr:hypothetical protein [Limimaricola sp.]
MRRTLTIWLHWGSVFLILMMIKGGTSAPALRWIFTAAGALWVGMAVFGGLLGRPGPKLTGLARAAYPWMHRGMYAALAVAAGLNLVALLGLAPRDWAWTSLLVLLAAGMLHGIFHLWRHTTLYDGALKMMAPRILHKHL